MRKLLDLAKWRLARGRDSQTFLGAGWVKTVLDRSPAATRRLWALRLLSLTTLLYQSAKGPAPARFEFLPDEPYDLSSQYLLTAISRGIDV